MSCARRWKRWWFCVWRSSTTRPQEEHSVIDLPELVVAHCPCVDEQYGRFIFFFQILRRVSATCVLVKLIIYTTSKKKKKYKTG